MSDYTAQRDAIAAILGAVTDIGQIHNRPRYGDAHEHWVATIGGVDQIRAWEIGVDEAGIDTARLQQHHRHRYINWRIQGYVGIDDEAASYHIAMTLAETIADALEADQKLTGTALDHEPAQIEGPTVLRIGGGFLCWGVTITMRTLKVVTP